MNLIQSKFLSTGLFFLFIFLSGIGLRRGKKPYSMLSVTLHKLIALAAGFFLGQTVYRLYKATPLTPLQIAAVLVTILFFAVNVATGSLLSSNKPMPKLVSSLNRFFPYLTVVSTGIMLYLLT